MSETSITFACADYARVMPLITGAVAPENVKLTCITGHRGSWGDRAAILRRGLSDPAIDAAESSMGAHLLRIAEGDRRFVALPVFVLRNFTARDLYVRKDGPVRGSSDLAGRRLGMYSWVASGSIWYRHFLSWSGLDLDAIEWWIGPVDVPEIVPPLSDLPPSVHAAPGGRTLPEMLIGGEIDALYSPPRPHRYHRDSGPIVRLIPGLRETEQRYYRDTGVYPPQHLVVMRREVWERDRSLAHRLTDSFIRNNRYFATAQRQFPYATPWLELELEETEALMGPDFHPDGLEPNRKTMELFCETAYRAGLTQRLVSVDDYFAEFLTS